MSGEARSKPDGSAWKAHMEGLSARNEATRKAGRQEREAYEHGRAAELRAAEKCQDAALRRSTDRRGDLPVRGR